MVFEFPLPVKFRGEERYIYIFKIDKFINPMDDLYKIGISVDLKNRMIQLVCTECATIELVAYGLTTNYGGKEFKIHKKFDVNRMENTEYFIFNDLEIGNAISFLQELCHKNFTSYFFGHRPKILCCGLNNRNGEWLDGIFVPCLSGGFSGKLTR